MRIITGQYRGSILLAPKDNRIRPTTDRVKETLFNILSSKNAITGSVLDLFCGSGALGLEAISRGASECVFVDNDRDSITLTQSNIDRLGVTSASVRQEDAFMAIKYYSRIGKQFGLVFVDPPYDKGYETRLLERIADSSIIDDKGLVVLESDSSTAIRYEHIDTISMIDKRQIGGTTLRFYQKITIET